VTGRRTVAIVRPPGDSFVRAESRHPERHRIDPERGLVPLELESWRSAWQVVRSRHPEDFGPLPTNPRRFLLQRDREIPLDLVPRLKQLGVLEVWVRYRDLEFLEDVIDFASDPVKLRLEIGREQTRWVWVVDWLGALSRLASAFWNLSLRRHGLRKDQGSQNYR